MAASHAHGGGGRGGGGWAQDVAWAPGDGSWGNGEGVVREGAGQTLVHETHAPKRISHIQFGLLNAEVSCCGVKKQLGRLTPVSGLECWCERLDYKCTMSATSFASVLSTVDWVFEL